MSTFDATYMIQEYLKNLAIWIAPNIIQTHTNLDTKFLLTVFNQTKGYTEFHKETGVTIEYRTDSPNKSNLRGFTRVGIITSFNFYDPKNKPIWDSIMASTMTVSSNGLPTIVEKV